MSLRCRCFRVQSAFVRPGSPPSLSILVAVIMLLTCTVIAPGAVLCSGPGSHFHVETVLGTSCNVRVQGGGTSTPRLPDGCPEGSRDFRLKLDSHRSYGGGVLSQVALIVGYASSGNGTAVLLQTKVSLIAAQRDLRSPSSVILRL